MRECRRSQTQYGSETFNKICTGKMELGSLSLIQGQLPQLAFLICQHPGQILQGRTVLNLLPDMGWELIC